MNGNMTHIEKQFNKDDLIAYKNYDKNNYSLVPGISPVKKVAEWKLGNNPEENPNRSMSIEKFTEF